jgi:dCTP deaminase
MILGKSEILRLIKSKELAVDPLSEICLTEDGIDLRLGSEIMRLRQIPMVLDTRKVRNISKFYKKETGSSFVIGPGERALACTMERISLSRKLVGLLNIKSTYARIGLLLPYGFVNSGFQGQLTIEILGGSFPIKLYAMDRMFHLILAQKSTVSPNAYRGKYQNQRGVTLPLFNFDLSDSDRKENCTSSL